MQTWILAVLLVLSLFANGYLFAQRAAPSAGPPPDAALTGDLQRLLDDLDAEPEWRHRLVSLGRFATARDERRRTQRRLVHGELFGHLADPAPDFDAVSSLLEDIGREDSHYRSRVLEQLIVLLNDLDASKRMILLERFRLLELDLDDFARFERLQP
ncbi:periplasmic heavy metal sensor [Thioalkalivibrio thiocyanodenitrificans]|uniref:periplasmic heavy metal sensor n=1 Tax=Thioalkalivibrio thiocyanodenitrificans TaxID=243063 RepID=UPI00035CD16C|nr:periplasmic heavy metal sensor [Thioalkalivibrio thiocyanodenitrificans]